MGDQQKISKGDAAKVGPKTPKVSGKPDYAEQSGGVEFLLQNAMTNPRALTQEHILQLQRTIGNQAAGRLLNPVASPFVKRTDAHLIQRDDGAVEAPEVESEDPATLQSEVSKQVGELPPAPPPEQVPDASKVEEAQGKAKQVVADLPVDINNKPNLAQIAMPIIAPQSEVEQEKVPEAPKSAGAAPKADSTPAPVSDDAQVEGASKDLFFAGDKNAAKKAANVGKTVGGHTVTGLRAAGVIAQKVGAIVGVFLNAIQALFDLRAVISSGMKYRALKQIAADAKKSGHDSSVVDAVEFAMNQKYGKAWMRLISFAAATTAATIGIIALATGATIALFSNPVGWGVLTVLAAIGVTVGIAYKGYRILNALYKSLKGTKGKKRREVALVLYDKLVKGDPIALAAINELGLPAQKIIQASQLKETGDESKTRQDHIKTIKDAIDRNEKKWQAAQVARDGKKVKHYEDKLAELKKQLVWKGHTKDDRNYIKLIERKLGK